MTYNQTLMDWFTNHKDILPIKERYQPLSELMAKIQNRCKEGHFGKRIYCPIGYIYSREIAIARGLYGKPQHEVRLVPSHR